MAPVEHTSRKTINSMSELSAHLYNPYTLQANILHPYSFTTTVQCNTGKLSREKPFAIRCKGRKLSRMALYNVGVALRMPNAPACARVVTS